MHNTSTLPQPTGRYLQNCRWIMNHHADLLRQYGAGWIAVYGGRVLASGPALGPVTDAAERLAAANDIAYQFLDDATMIY